MFPRHLSAALYLFLLLPAALPAQDTPPTVRLQIKSLDAVAENLKLLVSLAGKEDLANQIEGLIKSKIGAKGLDGIDTQRPFGAYGRFGKDINDVSGILLIPIADEKAFVGLLENLNFKVEKNQQTGIYALETPAPVPMSFRFANKYAYVTALNLDALDPKKLLPPEKVFSAQHKGVLRLALRLDQFPDAAKFIAKAQLEQKLLEAQEQQIPNETEAQKAFRLQVGRAVVDHVTMVLTDGGELNFDVNIDTSARELSATLSLAALPDSPLAKLLKNMGSNQSVLASLHSKDAAIQGGLRFNVPPTLHKSLETVFDEAQAKVLEKIKDDGKRGQLEDLFKTMRPTVQAGQVDAALAMHGPDANKHLSIVAGVRVKDGAVMAKKVNELLAELWKDLPPAEKAKIKLNAENAGNVAIHRFDFSATYDANAKKLFGAAPLYVAFRSDALLLAVGPEALPILKTGLAGQESPAKTFQLEVSLAHLVPLLGKKDLPKIPADAGSIRVTVEGGTELKLALRAPFSLVPLISHLAAPAKAKAAAVPE